MVFFQRSFYTPAPTASFTPLFHLLNDFDSCSRRSYAPRYAPRYVTRRTIVRWQPRFDVHETSGAYELHGELPGLSKEDVQIEFVDHNSMVIRGKIDRTHKADTTEADAPETTAPSDAITEPEETERPRSPYQATVEDEVDEEAPAMSSTPTEAQVTKAPSTTTPATAPKQPADTSKFSLSERTIGEFSRTFNFPVRIDQDSVTASFKDGILHVVVPKAAKHVPHRIAVL